MTSSWIELAGRQVPTPQLERIRGIDMTVYVSPYSAPTAVRGALEKATKDFIISFRYLNEGEAVKGPVTSRDGMVEFYLGAASGRIERVRVRKQLLDRGDVELRIQVVEEARKGISELKENETSLSRRLGFGAVGSVIESTAQQLVDSWSAHPF